MPQIIPIKDLRDTQKVSEICNMTNEPIFITKNGYGDMVIMSMAAYESKIYQLEVYNRVMESKAQADKGETVDGPKTMQELRAKYGL